MFKNKILFIVVIVSLIISTISCYPIFENPLPRDPAVQVDTALLGDWVVYENGTLKNQLSIGPQQGGWLNIVYIYDIDENHHEKLNLMTFRGYISALNSKTYVVIEIPSDKETRYIIARYSLKDKNTLLVDFLSKAKMQILIESNRLNGKIQQENIAEGKLMPSVIVTSEPNVIARVLCSTADHELFDEGEYSHFQFVRPK